MTLSSKQVAGLVGIGGLALAFLGATRSKSYTAAEFFQPQTVSDIAANLPVGEDEFILAAWRFVGGLQYEAIGSVFTVEGQRIDCSRCYLPLETLGRNQGNCVAKASLLSSILLNRLSPGRVYIAIGDLDYQGSVGGHSWVLVERQGGWYVLEATSPPKAQPWMTASSVSQRYIPYVLLGPNDLVCEEPQLCLKVAECPCMNRL